MLSNTIQFFNKLKSILFNFDFISPLLFRLILAPTMIIAGYSKLNFNNEQASFFESLLADPNVISWFGNTEWGLGLPFPSFLAFLAGWTEFIGGWFILFGLLTRLVSIPLIITMAVAISHVHWQNGWFAIAPSSAETSPAKVLGWLGFEQAQASLNNSLEVSERLERINVLIENHGYPSYLLEKGAISIMNNGIEFAAIYLAMLVSLLFSGGGRLLSLDYWLFKEQTNNHTIRD